jgi:DNA-3-methyladenine glycosylase I
MSRSSSGISRCGWVGDDPLMIRYHDDEWGLPVHDDAKLFELLTLEGAQAGLSWRTVLHKREGYRTLFKNFDPRKVARFTSQDVERLMGDASIIRNRLKIESTIHNAKAVLAMAEQHGSFDAYIWSFVDGEPIVNCFKKLADLPAKTELSDRMSKQMKRDGFRFVGSTVIYAFMQAAGLVNDHLVTCPRHAACC